MPSECRDLCKLADARGSGEMALDPEILEERAGPFLSVLISRGGEPSAGFGFGGFIEGLESSPKPLGLSGS